MGFSIFCGLWFETKAKGKKRNGVDYAAMLSR